MLSVLIVDDEPIFRMGLRSGINWADLDCKIIGEASNGKEALSIIEEKKPNIILLDIKMPGMDGIELLKTVVSTLIINALLCSAVLMNILLSEKP